MKKHRYIYKITCLVKESSLFNHYYIGQHVTGDMDDGYAGSGIKIGRYYAKYGKIEGQTYKKEILTFASSDEELNELEYQYIGDKWETDSLCLNMRAGGVKSGWSKETRENLSASKKQWWKNNYHRGIEIMQRGINSEQARKKSVESLKKTCKTSEHRDKMSKIFKEIWKDETKRKLLSDKNKKFYENESNRKMISERTKVGMKKPGVKEKLSPWKNKVWVKRKDKCIPINKEELQSYLDEGWVRGTFQKRESCHNKGTKMINNGTEIKLVKPEELQSYLDKGWKLGKLKKGNV